MLKNNYQYNIFINIPFDKKYFELRNALMFAIYDCGFVPRCALEEDNGANIRVEKIIKLIEASKYGVHDISRTELDKKTKLPRFNMPLELGIFLGAKSFGQAKHKNKNCLILDREPYRYQSFISDIAGYDIRPHSCNSNKLISVVRNWLNNAAEKKIMIPGGSTIAKRYKKFKSDLPIMCKKVKIHMSELTFNDYSQFISEWLKKNS